MPVLFEVFENLNKRAQSGAVYEREGGTIENYILFVVRVNGRHLRVEVVHGGRVYLPRKGDDEIFVGRNEFYLLHCLKSP